MTDTAEVIQFQSNEIAAFSEFRSQLATLKHDNQKTVFNYADPKGNKEARSHIYKLRQTKAAVEKVRKEQKQESLEYGRRVDQQAKEIQAELEEMIELHEAPLREIEQREAARVAAHKERISTMLKYTELEEFSSNEAKAMLAEVEAFAIDDSLQEFKPEAAMVKDSARAALQKMIEVATKREEEAAELARLREQAQEQARKDHEAKIAQQAREAAEREAQHKAEQERREREAEETRLKLQAETAERNRLEAEKRAKDAEERAEREIKEAAERAERERVAKIKSEAADQRRREADKKHRASINNAAVDAMVGAGIAEETAKTVITLIAKGEVPSVAIHY